MPKDSKCLQFKKQKTQWLMSQEIKLEMRIYFEISMILKYYEFVDVVMPD